MKKLIVILLCITFLIIGFLISLLFKVKEYQEDVEYNTRQAVIWVDTHIKPIKAYRIGNYNDYVQQYMFIDSLGSEFNTGPIKMCYPDSIK